MQRWTIGMLIPGIMLGMFGCSGKGLEDTFPPLGNFVSVQGTRMHYTDRGSGQTVVLIHGASTSLMDFEASLVKPLAGHFRVIAIDRPGHGYSGRPDGAWPDPAEQAGLIHDLLVQLGVERPVIVGHSWAGSVVLAYLLAYPQESSAGVLLAGGSHPWKGGVAWYNDVAGIPLLGDAFAWTFAHPVGSLALDSAVEAVFAPNDVPPRYRERTGVALTLRPETFLANAQDVRRLSDFLADQSQHYADITMPLLVFTGEQDDIVPSVTHADQLEQQVQQLQRIDFANTGHALHHVRTDEVVAEIEAFIGHLDKPMGNSDQPLD